MTQAEMQRYYWYNRMMNVTARGYRPYVAGTAPSIPDVGEPGFIINGKKVDTFCQMLNELNSSTEPVNNVKLLGNMSLDETETGTSIDFPTIQKNLVFDLNGYTIETNTAFSKANSFGWGDRLFRIQQSDGQPNIDVTIKNGKIKSVLPVGADRAGFLYTESTGEVNLENLEIDWDISNLPGDYSHRMAIIGYCGSNGAILTNVKCTVIGNNYQGCFEAQTYDEASHSEYEFNINNCEFVVKNVNPASDPVARQSRNSAIVAGGGVTVNINGGKMVGENSQSVINTFSTGAIININNSNIISNKTEENIPGPCVFTEYNPNESSAIFPIVTLNNVNCTFPESSASEMFAYQPYGATSGGMSKFLLNGGAYEKFIFTETTPTLQTIVSAGTFDRDISQNTAVQLAEGKVCLHDAATGKWIVQDRLPIEQILQTA